MKTGLKKLLSLMMALAMVASLGATAYAEDIEVTSAGTSSETQLVLNHEGQRFKAKVPTQAPFYVNSDGVTSTADNLAIENLCAAQIKVTDVDVVASGWTLVDYEKDMSKVAVNTKEFGVMFQNDKTDSTGDFVFNEANWPVLDGVNDSDSDILVLDYMGNFAAQSEAIDGAAIGELIITLDYNTAA